MAKVMKSILELFVLFMLIYYASSSEVVDSNNEVSVNSTEDYISRALGKLMEKKPSIFFCLGKLIKANPAIISPDPIKRNEVILIHKIFVDLSLGIMQKRHGEPWFQRHFCDFYKVD
ncbi:uncharacterized protein LOC141855777 [Brevipalpus obovatus]|uniref:uncharacterized protein LOC141855777 n=1 Tax=Brevipalpus obovatus TaxID=246614 RepID=UPI003D9E4AE7